MKFFDLARLEDLGLFALPVGSQAFEEMVTFNITVVVGARHIRRVHVNQIYPMRIDSKDITSNGTIILAVVKDSCIVRRSGLKKVLFEAQT